MCKSRYLYSYIGLFIIAGFFSPTNINAQSYIQMIESGQYRVQEIIDSANVYFQDSDKGRGTGYNPYKRWEYMALQLMDEDGYLKSHEYLQMELERFTGLYNQQAEGQMRSGDYWTEMGPQYWNATSSWNPGVGRLTAFTVDPDDHNHIIVGAQTGGVWKTKNGGVDWIPLCDFFSNMAVYSTAMHPYQKNIYYFGSDGGRIYRSIDEGITWEQIGSAGNSLVNNILIHPDNPNLMFACSQAAGHYRSENAGASWTKITGDGAAFDFILKPGDNQTILASGNGFHRSIDGGMTFTSIEPNQNLTILTPAFLAGNYVALQNSFSSGQVPLPSAENKISGKLVAYLDGPEGPNQGCGEPFNPEELDGNIVLIRRGDCTFAQKVLNAQAAGARAVIIFNNIVGNLTLGGGDNMIAIPALGISQELGTNILKALSEGEEIHIEIFEPSNDEFGSGPKMIGVSASNPEIVYVLEAASGRFGGLYKSTDGGMNFTKLDHSGKNYFGYSTLADDDRGQAPRDMAIAVNPYNADEVHIAGILTWRSMDGGVTFNATSDWIHYRAWSKGISYCHADVDIMQFVDSILYVGTDGGLFRAANTSTLDEDYYEDLTSGLGIRQFYKIGISQTNPVIVSGGSQDNGTSVYSTQFGWLDWLGADGMETFIDKSFPEIMYGTSQNGRMYRTFDGGFSYEGIDRPGSGDGNWVTPFEQDPILDDVIYVAYEQVFRSDYIGFDWVPISQQFPSKLNHMKIAPSNNQVIYASHQNNLYKTTTGAGIWTQLTGFSGNITSIAIHPRDPNRVALATNSSDKVYITENGGQHWIPYRMNLPDFSALALVWHDGLLDGLYLGMNYGIYYTDNNLNEWLPFSNHLPNVIVNELEINYADGRIYAGTYGRGLWSSPLFEGSSSVEDSFVDQKINIYPNPAITQLNINWEQAANLPSRISIFDVHGRRVRYYKDAFPDHFKIDLIGLNTGIYYIQLANTLGTFTRKVLIGN
jgi:photosystem II stability/assembly factor-like uncharacterized protein